MYVINVISADCLIDNLCYSSSPLPSATLSLSLPHARFTTHTPFSHRLYYYYKCNYRDQPTITVLLHTSNESLSLLNISILKVSFS